MGAAQSNLLPATSQDGCLGRVRSVGQLVSKLDVYAQRKGGTCHRAVHQKLTRVSENLRAFQTFLHTEVPRLAPSAFLQLFDDIMLCQELLLKTFRSAHKLLKTSPLLHSSNAIATSISTMCVDLEDALWLLRDAILEQRNSGGGGHPRTASPTPADLQPPASLLQCATPQHIAKYQAAAEKGDAASALTLGLLLLFGMGIAANAAMAADWITMAADAGIADALYWRGRMAEHGLHNGGAPDMQLVKASLTAAMEKHHGEAALHLGLLLEGGGLGAVDLPGALRCYRAASAAGCMPAYNNVGRMLLEGRGCGVDAAEAVECFKAAAEHGSAAGMCNLAVCYQAGQGVPIDKGAARRWLLRAIEAGSTRAHTHLAYLAIELGDMDEAVQHLDVAARAGDGEAVQALTQLCKQALQEEGGAAGETTWM